MNRAIPETTCFVEQEVAVMRDTTATLPDRRFSVDTTFVLFFLAMDFGLSPSFFAIESVASVFTLAVILVLPYFLPADVEKPDLVNWLLGRTLITVFAVTLGMMFQQGIGVLLPEAFRFLPMTLLILTAMVSCYLQFCAMIRFRLAR
jgi:hypothetical protein